jgi:Ca2+-binding RTX toxin-like protein
LGNDNLTGGILGRDRFVVAAGEGTDTITDFERGRDLIGLSGGFTFADLTISQGMGADISNTLIQVNGTNETLAILSGIQANTITAANFVIV